MPQSLAADAHLVPTDGVTIRESVTLKPGTYLLPAGLNVANDDLVIDGNGATLIGVGREGAGVRLEGRKGVTIKNLRIRDYRHGIHAADCERLRIEHCAITSTAEIEANTIFLDIWLDVDHCYGGGILLDRVRRSEIIGNDLQHQMNGLLTYRCEELTVRDNNANYSSGFGFHLYGTTESLFENNYADYCCRYEPRGEGFGHVGADATGFLIVWNSCRNTFRGNYARLGGDGFFLAGLGKTEPCPCDDNLFEGNDASLSPNIAFEATFSARNVFRNNKADRCNYGFWLGFSRDNVIEDNRMVFNRQAGIAVENGSNVVVRGNNFQRNGHGVLVWTKFDEKWYDAFEDRRAAHHWTIEGNTFTRNDKAICVATDRDHGIRPVPPESRGRAEVRPHDFTIRTNDIQDNRVGVELHGTDRVLIESNVIHRNVECNFRREDDHETTIRNNLGAAGAYL